ncbi:hypothetical protein VF21_10022 [Pseudogymnoascus sp. 05NY08]|nr:hypothetical protein VF21_10022 [Pseudogymnoascus sp. 05NY08]
MENNVGEQDLIGNQGGVADLDDWMYDHLNSGEQGPIDNQWGMPPPQGETDRPDVADGDNVQPGENDQVPVETGGGTIEPGIHGPIPSTTYKSRERLAVAFGFSDGVALDTWMESEAFRPYFSDLQTNLDKIAGENSGYPKISARLAGVIYAINYEEENGPKRYSRLHQVEHFTSIDWHAVFVIHTVKHNFVNPQGAFFGKNMTPDDMRTRIWQAMLRAKLDNYRRRGPGS